jgi:hypothetical protein
MRHLTRIAVPAAVVLWALSGTAKGPDDDKPGRGPPPHASHARPAGSLLPHPRGSAEPGERGRRAEARREENRVRMEELRQTRRERRLKHIEAFRKHYPAELLGNPRVKDEFRVHARRMARLRRAEFVAKTELEEPKRSEVLARVKRLIEREEARHEKRVTRLRSGGGPAPSASVRPGLAAPKASAP